MQFDLQTRYYAQVFPTADTQVILHNGHPIGRLMIDRRCDQIHLVDISLLPEHRQAGIGTLLVKAIQDEAVAAGREVVLHVASASRARSLYLRLGFVTCAGGEVYQEMRWPAQGAAPCIAPVAKTSEGFLHEAIFNR
jgi:GNAT superfamily N-acetyltransferase